MKKKILFGIVLLLLTFSATAYNQTCQADELRTPASCWRFENNLTASLGSDATQEIGGSRIVGGKFGNGITISGSGDAFSIPWEVDNKTIQADFTIAFWFNSSDDPNAENYFFFDKDNEPSLRNQIEGPSDYITSFYIENGGVDSQWDDGSGLWTTYNDGQYHHFALIKQNGTTSGDVALYIDGAEITLTETGLASITNHNNAIDTNICIGTGDLSCSTSNMEIAFDELMTWGVPLNLTEILYLNNSGFTGNTTPAAPTSTQFLITALDNYTSSSLNNLTAVITGVGTFSTINGTIITDLFKNDSTLYEIIISSNQSGGYFSKQYQNINVSSDLEASLYQAELNLSAYTVVTNASITGANFSIGNYKITPGQRFYLSAGSYNVTFSHPAYYNKSRVFTISALDNLTQEIFDVFNSLLNITVVDTRAGSTISSFSGYASYGSLTISGSTTSTYLQLGLLKGLTYNLSVSVPGYATPDPVSLLVNQNFQNYSFNTYTTNSLRIYIRDENTNSLITQNITMTFSSNTSEDLYYTNNGTFYIDNLNTTEYGIVFNGSGYSVRTYTITIGNGTSQQLTAYLASGTSTTLFTIKDQDTNVILPDVLSTMYRFINGSWKPVESKHSDITGKVQFSYLTNTNYKFFLSKSEYDDYVFYLNPILFSTYSVGMTKSAAIDYEQDFDGVSIIYAPTFFNYGNTTNFNWIISAPSGNLINYGYTLIYPGGSSSQSGSNAIGDQLNSSITINSGTVFDTVQLNYFYETTTAGVRNFTFYYPIIFPQSGNYTFINNRDETYGLGIFERTLVITLLVILIVGIASFVGQPLAGLAVGLFVLAYSVYIGFIPLWLILPSMFFGVIFLMWKSGG